MVYTDWPVDIGVKERLTGALIVVALVVLLVPSILYGPGDDKVGAGQAADGPPLRSYSMDLGADAGQQAQGQSTLAPQNASTPEPEPAAEQTAPTHSDLPEPTLPVPAPSPAASPPASPPVAASVPKPAPAASEQPVPAGSWWVQLGSFSQSANAQRLVQQLSTKGFSARVSPVKSKGKELFRVRAGPVGDRAAATALQARLAAAGYKGSLVAP